MAGVPDVADSGAGGRRPIVLALGSPDPTHAQTATAVISRREESG
jgi:hypothetical protein